MTRRYLDDLEQATQAVNKGTYTCEVIDARSSETSKGGHMVWLDLKILGGPDDGSVVSVSINLAKEGEKGVIYTLQKLGGFKPVMKGKGIGQLPDEQQADAIAQLVVGQRIEADLSLQGQDAGAYAGSQQLDATRQIVDAAPPQVAPQQQTQTIAAETQTVVSADPPF